MAARAMWKGVIRFGEVSVPVKLYAAVQDRSVHFRLLHGADHAPIKQALVNPETEEVVAFQDARRAFLTPEHDLVVLRDEDLESLKPKASRDIRILQFLPPQAIDHRWYLRPYYLGPEEGAAKAWFALIAALADAELEGLAHWVMRNKAYVGALRLQGGYPLLISLRHAEEVVAIEELEAPAGAELDKRELGMAQQLMEMLAADFDPADYQDAYRARVQKLIEAKARGGQLRAPPAPKRRRAEELSDALEASLRQERKRA
jgi:DNA end-binding protein Ku